VLGLVVLGLFVLGLVVLGFVVLLSPSSSILGFVLFLSRIVVRRWLVLVLVLLVMALGIVGVGLVVVWPAFVRSAIPSIVLRGWRWGARRWRVCGRGGSVLGSCSVLRHDV
ncbi:hypothetical protein M433DRAFT_277186, partial [Acidomyces richmondensis BFW]